MATDQPEPEREALARARASKNPATVIRIAAAGHKLSGWTGWAAEIGGSVVAGWVGYSNTYRAAVEGLRDLVNKIPTSHGDVLGRVVVVTSDEVLVRVLNGRYRPKLHAKTVAKLRRRGVSAVLVERAQVDDLREHAAQAVARAA